MKISVVESNEIKAVVEVHNSSFEGFFLTSLGDNFLFLYYDSIRRDKEGILLGIYDEGTLCGFCAAAIVSKGFNSRIVKRNLIRFIIIGLKILVLKPSSFIHLVKNFTKNNPEIIDNGEYSELLSIGIAKNKQNQGIGKKILSELENQLLKRNCTNLSLTTDFNNNEKTIEFYKSLGYKIQYEFTTYPNRKMYRLIKNL
jgi:ribosomal protein S18 acetylase RimI-like enzyme